MTRLITALLLLQAIARFGRVAAADSTHAADQPAPSAVPSGLSGPDYTGPSAGSDECDPEMVGFELVTGYVFTAPTNMLESIPGTLMLTDCLETCQANDSCQAVNYETGLCVLFSSNADSNPGKIESLSYVLSRVDTVRSVAHTGWYFISSIHRNCTRICISKTRVLISLFLNMNFLS